MEDNAMQKGWKGHGYPRLGLLGGFLLSAIRRLVPVRPRPQHQLGILPSLPPPRQLIAALQRDA